MPWEGGGPGFRSQGNAGGFFWGGGGKNAHFQGGFCVFFWFLEGFVVQKLHRYGKCPLSSGGFSQLE